jgi:hypothetical protein
VAGSAAVIAEILRRGVSISRSASSSSNGCTEGEREDHRLGDSGNVNAMN